MTRLFGRVITASMSYTCPVKTWHAFFRTLIPKRETRPTGLLVLIDERLVANAALRRVCVRHGSRPRIVERAAHQRVQALRPRLEPSAPSVRMGVRRRRDSNQVRASQGDAWPLRPRGAHDAAEVGEGKCIQARLTRRHCAARGRASSAPSGPSRLKSVWPIPSSAVWSSFARLMRMWWSLDHAGRANTIPESIASV